MINSDKYFTIVFKDLTQDERLSLSNDYQDKLSASSYSHVMVDRDQLLDVLSYAECALGDIGDADREPGDDLEWCEERAAKALPRVRKLLLAHGRKTTSLWSADQELDACDEWLFLNGYDVTSARLRAARRPKLPSLKEEALSLLDKFSDPEGLYLDVKSHNTIRRALEQLDD
jgi:hypothetical protein